MKILYLSSFLPYEKNTIVGAGYNIILDNLKNLYKNGHQIDFCALVNSKEYTNKEYYENECIENLIIFEITKLKKIINIILNPQLPILCSVRYDRRLKKFLKEKSENYDLIIIDFTQNINYLKDIKNEKSMLIEHDISFQAFERKMNNEKNYFKKIIYKFEYIRLKKYEKKMISKFDKIVVLNEKDFKLIENENRNIRILKPFFNKFLIDFKQENRKINIGFLGAMNRSENEEAVIFFLTEVWKHIKKDNIHFYIIGANPSEKLKKILNKYSNVTLTGFVEKLEDYFSILNIGVIPLLRGAGIKIKSVEMLYSEIPLVSTSVGMEGIKVENGSEYLLAETSKEFISQINKLLNDGDLYLKIKRNLKEKKENILVGEDLSELLKN